jgi:hypothetical protein
MYAELIAKGDALLFLSSYDPALVNKLKALVPAGSRRWDAPQKAWIIDPDYGAVVSKLCRDHWGLSVTVPLVQHKNAATTRLLKVEYIGATKDRGNEFSAFGYVDGGWNVMFSESVLTTWFQARPTGPAQKPSLYGVLGLQKDADTATLKTAYRRLARQWHPDVCQEPDAREQFIAIQHAWEVLSNDLQRRKYDAGLALEASLGQKPKGLQDYVDAQVGYRTPLRCGYILCSGVEKMGIFRVNRIEQWADIVRGDGLVMISSWPRGADMFEIQWVVA